MRITLLLLAALLVTQGSALPQTPAETVQSMEASVQQGDADTTQRQAEASMEQVEADLSQCDSPQCLASSTHRS